MSKRKVGRRRAGAAVVERDGRPPVEAIRAAAFAQFAERGYPVVTVRDIMKACGLTQGALYNHFKSKDELLHDIIASTQAELERRLPAGGGGGGQRSARQAGGLRARLCHAPLPAPGRGAGRQPRDQLARRRAGRRHPPQPPRHPRHRGRHPGRRARARRVRSAAGRRPARPQGAGDGAARPVDARLDVVRAGRPPQRGADGAALRRHGACAPSGAKPQYRASRCVGAPRRPARPRCRGSSPAARRFRRTAAAGAACVADGAGSSSIPADRWRAVLVAGDNSSPAFDNGIDTLRERFAAMGVRDISVYLGIAGDRGQLSSRAQRVERACARGGGEACLVYMTSHGDESGFFLRPDRRLLDRRPRSTRRSTRAAASGRPCWSCRPATAAPSSTPRRAGPTASSWPPPRPTARASAAAPTTTTPTTTSASCSSSTAPRPGAASPQATRACVRDARAAPGRPPRIAAAALRRRGGRRPEAAGALGRDRRHVLPDRAPPARS